jgi:hypothetical protein
VDPPGQRSIGKADLVAASAQFSWPPAFSFLAVSVQDLMAADTPSSELPARTWWMWAGQQRTIALGGRLRTRFDTGRDGGHEESLRRTRGEAVGEELDAAPVNRALVNVRTIPELPYPPPCQGGDGQARDRPVAQGWGVVLVVVRGRESRLHGEGGQRVRKQGTGRSGG